MIDLKEEFLIAVAQEIGLDINVVRRKFDYDPNPYINEYTWFRYGIMASAARLKDSGRVATSLANTLLEEL